MTLKETPLVPFGIQIEALEGKAELRDISNQQIFAWLKAHKVLVLKGFTNLPKQELALYGQRLGEPLQWAFGAINDLRVKADADNYIFTDHAVPMHWDGAFAGKIPHVILFQCIQAPAATDLGGTTFCDTSAVLAHATPEQIDRWRKISVNYKTKKVVHYGGSIDQTLIAQHAVDGTEIMRYAEPVHDLNPVALKVTGLESQSEADFIQEMEALLYDPRHLLVHRWEDGDIVMADNHSLLHGREAFLNPSSRYIQRLNILHRPAKSGWQRYLKNCFTIRRKEFFVAELPIFLIPLLLTLEGFGACLQPALWVGLAALFLLFNIGDMINCYSDYELDAIYKSHLSNAVYELGKPHVKAQIVVSGILATIFIVIASLLSAHLYLIPIALFGLVVGLQYSTKPFKFKSRGLWQLPSLWGIIFFGPMVFTAILAKGFPSAENMLFFAAFGLMQMGIIMLNTAEDFPEDQANGVRTMIIAMGLQRAMKVAFGLTALSGIVLIVLIARVMEGMEAGSLGYLLNGVFVAAWGLILWEYAQVLRKFWGKNDEEAAKVLKKNGMKVPRWLKFSAYSILVPLLLKFLNDL